MIDTYNGNSERFMYCFTQRMRCIGITNPASLIITCSSIDLTKLPSTLPQGSITKSRYASIELVSVEQ